jgi:uncharacterized membrane protein
MEKRINKEMLYSLYECSSLEKKQFEKLVEEYSCTKLSYWKKFAEYFFLTLGSGFFLSGITFFFAYNWNNIPGFWKFGIILFLLIVLIVISISKKIKILVQKMSLFGASVLVGVLLAVFGQEYQTGANAYDLFLVWTIAVFSWTAVSQFTPQWLFWSILSNITLILYFNQVISGSNIAYLFVGLLLLNIFVFIIPYMLGKMQNYIPHSYYRSLMVFVCNFLSVIGVAIWLFSETGNKDKQISEITLLLISIIWIVGSFYASLKIKNILMFSYFALTVVSIVLMLLYKVLGDSEISFLIYTLYVLSGTYALIKIISHRQRKWSYEA